MALKHQFLYFAVIGVTTNGLLYMAYVLLTAVGMGPKIAMTLLFAAGVAWTYALNRIYTFRHPGEMRRSAIRYLGVYAVAYAGNLASMYILVDVARLPHRIVMLSLIAVTALATFAVQRLWVFAEHAPIETINQPRT